MATSRRAFIRTIGKGLAGATVAAGELACAQGTTGEGSELLLEHNPDHVEPAPKGYDRLPLEWHQARTRLLKERVTELGASVILLGSDQNQVYYTGCFRRSGERSTWVVFPVEERDTVYWYSPGIDRDLITSWWATENEYYFGYPHAEGAYPNLGKLPEGPTVDLFEWMLAGLKRRGFSGKTVAFDRDLTRSELRSVRKVVPGTRFVNIGGVCQRMQIVKTPEEIALLQRAYRYFDKIHAFARDYILEHGTDATDFELGQALQAYGIALMMNDVTYDGRPHTAVGIESSSNYVRAGVASAYPHPNQFFYSKIQRGQTVYVNTDIKLGGLGGECYRNYLIGPWTQQQEKMWEVVAESIQIQEEESKAGAVCADIARKIHQHQIDRGVQHLIYHRPAHGQGQFYQGHQPPFVALGDHSVLEENMTFSMEPGLYDSEAGVGINPSDNLRVTATKGVRFSSVPFSKEWSFLTL
ncbi:MAG: M24 family metallopeptidase [Gemmatimonadales bacterium]